MKVYGDVVDDRMKEAHSKVAALFSQALRLKKTVLGTRVELIRPLVLPSVVYLLCGHL